MLIPLFIADMSRSCRNDQEKGFYDEFFADTASEESSDWDEHEILDGPIRFNENNAVVNDVNTLLITDIVLLTDAH